MIVRGGDPILFYSGELHERLQEQGRMLREEVERYDGNKLLNTPVDDLCAYFEQKYRFEPLVLLEDQITTDHRETTLDVTRLGDGSSMFPEDPRSVPATAVVFFVPFTGDATLFELKPGATNFNPPHAMVQDTELVLTFVSRDPGNANFKDEFAQELRNVKFYVAAGASTIDAFNGSIRAVAKRALEERRQRLLRAANTTAALGFPMKRREGAPMTFAAPNVRRKIAPVPPRASGAPYEPEPALDMGNYEHILSVIQNMTLVLERSPSAFKKADEEAIRQHFLVQLNGQYEGSATGETFNGEGKTDILIRQDGKNVFIAECKFWKGSASLTEAVDQLLSYTTWRDTKTALLVFVREIALSTVLAKVPEILKQHPSFKRDLPVDGETRFRSVFGQPKDPSRELYLTTLVFNVPH
jgi:hypothetical protein